MKSLTDLQALAASNGLPTHGSREDIMDRLRDALGTFDPGMQIDPMKAADLKREIKWAEPDLGLGKYLNLANALEPKLDGARMRVFLGSTANSMNTGRRSERTFAYIDRSDNFPHLRDAVDEALAGTILDGELVAPSPQITTATGTTTNSLLNATVALVNVNSADAVKTQQRYGKAVFMVFDILACRGESVTQHPYRARRKLLEMVVGMLSEIEPAFQLIPSFPATAETLQACFEHGFEGAIIKSQEGEYEAGKRSRQWLKVKQNSTFDGYVTGWIAGEGKNTGKVGAVKLSVMGPDGKPVEVAQPGAFTDAFRDQLTNVDGELSSEWYGKVMECSGQGVTKGNRVRHPVMVRLRPDKAPVDCGLDQLDALPRV